MATIKWSSFPSSATLQAGDKLVGLHAGLNYQLPVSFAPSPSTMMMYDANSNSSANNYISSSASTVTSAGTTTLTVASPYAQYFTGTTTQNVVMPVVTTLTLNQAWKIINNSTGIITIKSSGGNTITTLTAGASATITCIALTGTDATSWSISYSTAVTPFTVLSNLVFTFATPGDLSVAYSIRNMYYDRIDSLVNFRVNLTCTPTFTTASGAASITGLPITSNATSGSGSLSFGYLIGTGTTLPANTSIFAGLIVTNSTSIALNALTSTGSGTFAGLTTSNFTSGNQIQISLNGFYWI